MATMTILNNSPVLQLSEIIVQLFNNELLADVIFSCGDKVIYAHSFLLMSRSVVYETEYRSNQGVQKLIPIQKYDYETFYEYVRFIYTDACKITNKNVMALLELSLNYKIPRLENLVIGFIIGGSLTFIEKFKIYEFCEMENYQLLRNWVAKFIGPLVSEIINSDHFTTIQPKLLESILKRDYIGTATKPVKEVDLFYGLIKWMNHYCTKNGIALSERRLKFDGLIRLIRFPIMMFADLIDCIKKSDNLFTDSDYVAFFKSERDEIWNCTARQVCATENPNQLVNRNNPCGYGYHQIVLPKQTQQFEITEKQIITGLRFISNDITSFQLNQSTTTISQLLNMQVTKSSSFEVIVSLGESFVLQPGSKYIIDIPTAITSKVIYDVKPDLVDKEFIKYYKELARDSRLVEIFFKTP